MKLHWPVPPPSDFNEGQRALYGCLAAAAGMFCGACAVAMVALLMWGHWSKTEEHTIVVIFGYSLGGFIVAMIAVIIGLMVGGPVGRFKMDVSLKNGLGIDTGKDAAPTVTTTTTVNPTGNAGGPAT